MYLIQRLSHCFYFIDGHLDNQAKYPFYLSETLSYQPSFISFQATICFVFNFVNPSTPHNRFAWRKFNQRPSVVSLKSLQFCHHSFFPAVKFIGLFEGMRLRMSRYRHVKSMISRTFRIRKNRLQRIRSCRMSRSRMRRNIATQTHK